MTLDTKLVVISNGNYFSRLELDALFERRADQIAGVLIITGDYKKRTKLRALWELSKCTATPYILYKVSTYLALEVVQRFSSKGIFNVEKAANSRRIPVRHSLAVNTKLARSWVSSLDPDLLISSSCPQLIGPKMLSLARFGAVNVHASLLPRYAGLAPNFWVLSSGEQITGTTAHYITPMFDEGNILVQERLTIEVGESAYDLFQRLATLGSEVLDKAVTLALEGSEGIQQDLSNSTYCSHPSFDAYLKLRKRGHRLLRIRELWRTIRNEIHG